MESNSIELKKFMTMNDAIDRAKRIRKSINSQKIPKYPIKALNDFLVGMSKSSLTVVAAYSGIGKTQFVNETAFVNAMSGKKVYLFSLEGDKDEVVTRLQWQKICEEYYKKPKGKFMYYPNFINNLIEDIDEYEDKANALLKKVEDNLLIYDRSVEFSIDILEQQMELIKDDADLIIIDHLHYFSLFENGETEAQQISKIMRKIKDLTELHQIPVLLVSHLRKKSFNDKKLIPDADELMGSSNIAKVATTVLMLAPIPDENDEKAKKYATAIRVVKSREGMKPNLGFLVMFDDKTKTYSQEYELLHIPHESTVKVIDPKDYLSWCNEVMSYNSTFKYKRLQNC